MTRYVIGPDVALHLAHQKARVPAQHQLLAPTLLRSQVLAILFGAVQQGELARKDAEARLDHLRGLRLRLLGDRVLQCVAWWRWRNWTHCPLPAAEPLRQAEDLGLSVACMRRLLRQCDGQLGLFHRPAACN